MLLCEERVEHVELLITVAGPAVNFALAAGLWLILPPANGTETDTVTAAEFGHLLLQYAKAGKRVG